MHARALTCVDAVTSQGAQPDPEARAQMRDLLPAANRPAAAPAQAQAQGDGDPDP